jgi:hypothetical protein
VPFSGESIQLRAAVLVAALFGNDELSLMKRNRIKQNRFAGEMQNQTLDSAGGANQIS